MVGIDVHKDTHTVVAVDDVGRQLGQPVTVRATDAGYRSCWAGRGGSSPSIEVGCRRGLPARDGPAGTSPAGRRVTVVRVPPKLMAGARPARAPAASPTRSTRSPSPGPPARAGPAVAQHDDASRKLKLLVDHREDLVIRAPRRRTGCAGTCTSSTPSSTYPPAAWTGAGTRIGCSTRLEAQPGVTGRPAGPGDADRHPGADRADRRPGEGDQHHWSPPGAAAAGAARCGSLTAAKIVGETANVTRFRSEACFAMHAGVAPIPAPPAAPTATGWPAAATGNSTPPCTASPSPKSDSTAPASSYYQRRRAQGDTAMEALRALKRRLARVVFNLLQPTAPAAATPLPQAA